MADEVTTAQENIYSFSGNTSPNIYFNVTASVPAVALADCAMRCAAQPGCIYFNFACCDQKQFGSSPKTGNCELAGNGSVAALVNMPGWWPLFAGTGEFCSRIGWDGWLLQPMSSNAFRSAALAVCSVVSH